MKYSENSLEEINTKFNEVNLAHDKLLIKLVTLSQKLVSEKAREYLMQGVGRRIKLLARCINNIFIIFPVTRKKHLLRDELSDIDINLHAFFINIAGVFDNLGWVFVYENNLLGKLKDGKIPRNGVGLFCEETQKHINSKIRSYLISEPIQSWHKEYSKNYRDSLAHRIPLYVPPSVLNKEEAIIFGDLEKKINELDLSRASDREKYYQLRSKQETLGQPSFVFAHSIDENSKLMYFHAQILADFATVEKVIDVFCDNI